MATNIAFFQFVTTVSIFGTVKFSAILQRRPSNARTVLRKQLLVKPKPIGSPISKVPDKEPNTTECVCQSQSIVQPDNAVLARERNCLGPAVPVSSSFQAYDSCFCVSQAKNRRLSDRRMRMNLLTCTSPPSMGKPDLSSETWADGKPCNGNQPPFSVDELIPQLCAICL